MTAAAVWDSGGWDTGFSGGFSERDLRGALRWGGALLAALATHGLLALGMVHWQVPVDPPSAPEPVMMIDLAPLPPAPLPDPPLPEPEPIRLQPPPPPPPQPPEPEPVVEKLPEPPPKAQPVVVLHKPKPKPPKVKPAPQPIEKPPEPREPEPAPPPVAAAPAVATPAPPPPPPPARRRPSRRSCSRICSGTSATPTPLACAGSRVSPSSASP